MSAPDIQVVAGTTHAFTVTWSDNTPEQKGIDLTGCSAIFQVRSAGKLLVNCTTQNTGIKIDSPTTGLMSIRIGPEQTNDHTVFQWEKAEYELQVTFPSGDVYSVLRGTASLIRGVVHDG